MRIIFPSLFVLFIVSGIFQGACQDAAHTPSENAPVIDTMPANPSFASITCRDLNFWTEKGFFCIASIVDNQLPEWQKIWVRVELFDSAGQALTIDGKPDVVVRCFSDAIPPKGASSFFLAISLDRISGRPDSCRVTGAGAVHVNPGAILVSGEVGGVRMLVPDPKDSTKTVEVTHQISAEIDNPLNYTVNHHRIVILLYAKDKKLYFAEAINPEDTASTRLRLERPGPIRPQEKRRFYYPVNYPNLPERLQETYIDHTDVQYYEARQ
jgi:hypothetical protein